MAIKFDLPKDQLSIIKVIGVGGGGSNAVNHMYEQGIKDVDFMVCNTDQQALDQSSVPSKIQLGATLTSGLGAGARSEVGENAAIESIDEIKQILGQNTKMVFITAGMGGGTGTGAAPIIAKTAKDLGILTVGIVTMPFSFEGKKRRKRAEDGMQSLRDNVDTLLVINNDKLRELYGNLTLDNAFEEADNVLTTAAKGIAEAITYKGKINVDFNDVKTVMSNSGVAILGSAKAVGENRALLAIEDAVNSPLLNDNEINGAAHILLNITYGSNNILMDEISEITDFIEDKAHDEAEVIWGHGLDDRLQPDEISITIVATGFQSSPDTGVATTVNKPERIIRPLSEEVKTELTQPFKAKPEVKQASIFEQPTPEVKAPEAKEEPKPYSPFTSTPKIEEPKQEEGIVAEEPQMKQEEPLEIEDTLSDSIIETPEEPVEEKEIIRHTLEDDSWGSLNDVTEQNNAHSTASLEDLANDNDEFNMEPTLKSENAESTPEAHTPSTPTHSFEKQPEVEHIEEPVLKSVNQEPVAEEEEADVHMTHEERQSSIKDRMARLRNLSSMLKSPTGISSLESEPAFKRRSIELDDVKGSNESHVSRFTLSESEDQDGDKKIEIKSNNSFLHDNVD
ncbi:MAG: cell division protein FtsZ [Salibacteraceae bacterium]